MKMPALFVGHGNPVHAILRNGFTGAWVALGARSPRPKAIVCVSAHWYIPGTPRKSVPEEADAV